MKVRSLVASLILVGALPATAGAVLFQVPGHTLLNVRVRSLVELRFKNVVRQAYDISCGAAAMATLLKYYYAEQVTEGEAIEAMLTLGDKEVIQKEGFSLLEMKRFAERRGYVSAGYRIKDVQKLSKLTVPAITLVNVRGYAHFVVVKGVAQGQVFIADPAYGNRSRPLDSFAGEWNNVILLVMHETRAGHSAFTLDPTLKAPASDVMLIRDRGLRSISPGAGEF
ncbi:MAG: C39 family peptidase [Nitrospirales bacterium]